MRDDITLEDINSTLRTLVGIAIGGLILNHWIVWALWVLVLVAVLWYLHEFKKTIAVSEDERSVN